MFTYYSEAYIHNRPWYTSDNFELQYPIEAVRKLIQPDLSSGMPKCEYDKNIYWDELVDAYVKAWNETDVSAITIFDI